MVEDVKEWSSLELDLICQANFSRMEMDVAGQT